MAFCAKRETSVKRETRGGEKMGRSPRLAHKAPVIRLYGSVNFTRRLPAEVSWKRN